MIDELDQEIIDTLERIMDRTPSAGPTPSETFALFDSLPSRHPVRVAAGALALVGIIAIGVVVTQRVDNTSPQPFATDPPPATSSAPLLTLAATPPSTDLTLFPTVGSVARPGDIGSYSQIANENPERVSALLARRNGSALVDAIQIEAIGPGLDFVGFPESVVVHGAAALLYTEDGSPIVRTVVLPGDPVVLVTGTDPVGFLESVEPGAIGVAPVSAPTPGHPAFTLSFCTLPAGYDVIVAPFESPRGTFEATIVVDNTETSFGSMVGVSLMNPLPAFAVVGTLTQVDINGISGWLSSAPGNDVIWEPAPGTFAIASGPATPDGALAFARSVRFVDEAEWRQIYNNVYSG